MRSAITCWLLEGWNNSRVRSQHSMRFLSSEIMSSDNRGTESEGNRHSKWWDFIDITITCIFFGEKDHLQILATPLRARSRNCSCSPGCQHLCTCLAFPGNCPVGTLGSKTLGHNGYQVVRSMVWKPTKDLKRLPSWSFKKMHHPKGACQETHASTHTEWLPKRISCLAQGHSGKRLLLPRVNSKVELFENNSCCDF